MARQLPSLNGLRAYEAAARHSSFTKAAAELHVTHAAISRHVRSLERWLNVRLFTRLARGVELTEEGERYAHSLTPIFDALAAATRDVMAAPIESELTVSVEAAFASRWLVPRLGRFISAHPEIVLNVDPNNALVNFRSDPAELAIRYGEGHWSGVEVSQLVTLQIFPVCSPELIQGTPLEGPRDLSRFTLLHEATKQWWKEWLVAVGAADVDSRKGPLLKDSHLALQAAESGQGFALGDSVLAFDALKAGRLVKPLEELVEYGGYYLVRPLEREESTTARHFREWLLREMTTHENECGGVVGPRRVFSME